VRVAAAPPPKTRHEMEEICLRSWGALPHVGGGAITPTLLPKWEEDDLDWGRGSVIDPPPSCRREMEVPLIRVSTHKGDTADDGARYSPGGVAGAHPPEGYKEEEPEVKHQPPLKLGKGRFTLGSGGRGRAGDSDPDPAPRSTTGGRGAEEVLLSAAYKRRAATTHSKWRCVRRSPTFRGARTQSRSGGRGGCPDECLKAIPGPPPYIREAPGGVLVGIPVK